MKKLALFLLLFGPLAACSSNESNESKFYDTYKEIIIIRNNNSDPKIANKLVKEKIKENGYTDKSFKDEFIRLSESQPNVFARKIDSIRAIASGR